MIFGSTLMSGPPGRGDRRPRLPRPRHLACTISAAIRAMGDGVAEGSLRTSGESPRRASISQGSGRLLRLRLLTGVELDLLVRPRHAILELLAALDLGVELDAEQQRHVGQPEPDQEDHHARERTV